MRAKEFIRETKLRKGADAAIKSLQMFGNADGAYACYRFGVALASGPNQSEKEGPVPGVKAVALAYSDADQIIIDAAARTMGVSAEHITSKGSNETDTVNTRSPMNPQGPIKRKTK